jgi:hypothetical protein
MGIMRSGVGSQAECLPQVFRDEARVLAMGLYERLYERAERKHCQAAPACVFERFGNEALAQAAVLEALFDLGVDERDQPGTRPVLAVARQLTVEVDLVPVLV